MMITPTLWKSILLTGGLGVVAGYCWLVAVAMEPTTPLTPCTKPGTGELIDCRDLPTVARGDLTIPVPHCGAVSGEALYYYPPKGRYACGPAQATLQPGDCLAWIGEGRLGAARCESLAPVAVGVGKLREGQE